MIEQIKQEATTFGKALGNAGRWHLIGIVSRVLGLFLLIFTLVLCVLALFTLFVHPFIRLLSKHVIGTQEELVLETLKAEHEVDLQKVKIETRVENATREINFYANLLSRLWKTLSGWLHK